MGSGKDENSWFLSTPSGITNCIGSQFLFQMELTFHFSFLPVFDQLLLRDSSQPNRVHFAFTGLKGIKPIMFFGLFVLFFPVPIPQLYEQMIRKEC